MRCLFLTILIAPVFFGCGAFNPGRPLNNTENPPAVARASAAAESPVADELNLDIPTDAPSKEQPVTSGAAFSRNQLRPGEATTLVIRLRTAEPWYIYAVEGPTGVAAPTAFELSPPAFIRAPSAWSLPTAQTKHSPLGDIDVYKGDLQFSIPLTVAESAAAGTFEIPCTVKYQACSDRSCLPPAELHLAVPLTIVSE